jgi:hypothetical protein
MGGSFHHLFSVIQLLLCGIRIHPWVSYHTLFITDSAIVPDCRLHSPKGYKSFILRSLHIHSLFLPLSDPALHR